MTSILVNAKTGVQSFVNLPPPPEPNPEEIKAEWRLRANRSPARLILALAQKDWITIEEAEAWLEGRGLPALAQTLLANMPPMQALETKAFLLRMLQADRMDPLTLALAEAKRQTMDPMPTEEEMANLLDELFGWEE